ncbi:MAG: GAF domain-containing protein [Pseudonocardiaceae bacterium]|nr:MAG: GAF domain-containing protein [Pseudonocardiaceae bacterium]
MVMPSSNTRAEPATHRMLAAAPHVSVHVTRVPATRIALADGAFDVDVFRRAAELLADADVHAVAWNGTSGSWMGLDHDRALAAALSDATGAPTTTSTLALLDAFAAYGCSRVAVAVPYTADVTALITETYRGAGVEVVGADSLGLVENVDFGSLSADDIARQLKRAADGTDVHAAAVVCTNVDATTLVPRMERELGVPVVDSITATLWRTLQLAGDRRTRIDGYGRLTDDGALRVLLQELTDDLLARTGADRTTLRIDLPAHDLHVDLAAAEAAGLGVRSIRHDPGLDQRALDTVAWLEEHRRPLFQPHFREPPAAPQALRDHYGVQAQMLGPVVVDDRLAGWFSAHSLTERAWSAADVDHLTRTVDRAREVVGAIVG